MKSANRFETRSGFGLAYLLDVLGGLWKTLDILANKIKGLLLKVLIVLVQLKLKIQTLTILANGI